MWFTAICIRDSSGNPFYFFDKKIVADSATRLFLRGMPKKNPLIAERIFK
jgi:hypothetical protein